MKRNYAKVNKAKKIPWAQLSLGGKVLRALGKVLKFVVVGAVLVAGGVVILAAVAGLAIACGIGMAIAGGLSDAGNAYQPGDIYVRRR